MNLSQRSFGFLLVLALFACTPFYAQNLSVEKKIKPAFKKYFGMPRVSIFLHLNKSSYVVGEEIWFKGYLYNRSKSSLLKDPVNMYVSVYDSIGNRVKDKLFISKDGLSQGQIFIDSTFDKGLYYIKASTSWMDNFREDDSFISQFEVLKGVKRIKKQSANELDVQLLPEGGYLVSGVQGTVGVKVLNTLGKGVKNITGILHNSKGDSIATFRTNNLGFSKFEFVPESNDIYTVALYLKSGKRKKAILPKIRQRGIGMSVKRLPLNRIMILLGTNDTTRLESSSKKYTLLFHRDGLLKQMEAYFPEDENYVSFILEPSSLHPGINIITLIDDKGNPIIERLVFNRQKSNIGQLNTFVDIIDGDSISLKLSHANSSGRLSYLSASVLPAETKAYEHQYNILSTFLITPYLKGHIENPKYYFEEFSEKRDEDLDLLLLTQGWSRYNWDNIFKSPPYARKEFETGIDIVGRLNFELRKKQDIMFYPGQGTLPQIIKMKKDKGSFLLKNYLLEQGEELRFTAIDANGRLSRPSLFVRTMNGSSLGKLHNLPSRYVGDISAELQSNPENYNFILPDNTVKLNEVTVEGKQEDRVFVSPHFSPDKLVKVTKKTIGNFPRLLDLIRSSGFNIWEAPNTGYDRIRITSKRPSALSLTPPSPRLYVDDVPYSDFNILMDFRTNQLESYFIDRSGNGEPGAAGGVIRVYTKKGPDTDSPGLGRNYSDDNFFVHTVKNGFGPVKEFYMPKYANVEDTSFNNFGTVFWNPNIVLGEDGNATFNFNHLNMKRMKLFLEGIGEDGTLYSTMQEIEISPD